MDSTQDAVSSPDRVGEIAKLIEDTLRRGRSPGDASVWHTAARGILAALPTTPPVAVLSPNSGYWLKDAESILRENGSTMHADEIGKVRSALATTPLTADAGEVERLRKALRWYADPTNWWTRNSSNSSFGYHQMGDGSMERMAGRPGTITDGTTCLMAGQFMPDAGSRARAALAPRDHGEAPNAR